MLIAWAVSIFHLVSHHCVLSYGDAVYGQAAYNVRGVRGALPYMAKKKKGVKSKENAPSLIIRY
jgi:hypothetical protein